MSLRLCMRARGVDDVVRALAAVLRRHGVARANFAGHSFGTLVIAHMRKLFPESVASVLLCDPVRHLITHSCHCGTCKVLLKVLVGAVLYESSCAACAHSDRMCIYCRLLCVWTRYVICLGSYCALHACATCT